MNIRGIGALVTGGSRGLGAALAEALAREGARVAIVARGEAELEQVAARIRRAGGEAWALPGDVADKEGALELAGAAAELVGPIELLVHNASTLGPTPLPLLLDTACESLEEVLQVNLVGPFRLTKAVAGAMSLSGRGLIAHISSDAAVEAYARWGAYGASKAAQDHLARILGVELDGTGVRVLSVDPGEMDTAMHAAAIPEADRATLARPEAVAERIVRLLKGAETVPNGSRVVASAWEARS
jgi:NAD(P)-dependent dehydrogenase (short-subunit alcohol dehydrogenase family)